jgi:hypothetical protein
VYHLYSVALAGGPPIDLQVSLGYNRYFQYYLEFSADSQYVLLLSGFDWYYDMLYSVPVRGGQPIQLGDHVSIDWPPVIGQDSRHVVFTNRRFQSPGTEAAVDVLYSGAVISGASLQLAEHATIYRYQLTPDNRQVVYLAIDEEGGTTHLIVMPWLRYGAELPLVVR